MSVGDVAVGVLLAVGAASVALSCAGLVLAGNSWDKLHFTGPATVIAPVALAGAVLVQEPLSSAGIKAVLVAIVMLGTGPVVVHATARAARVRDHGRFVILSSEAERKEHPSKSSSR
jgi:multisubunit Na+/H+ antiporter MnhG subunit